MRIVWAALTTVALVLPLWAQRGTGELRLSVTDSTGAVLEATGTLKSLATQADRSFSTDPEGHATLTALPWGRYRLDVVRSGFAPSSQLLEIRSAVPITHQISLTITPVETAVLVTDAATLLQTQRVGSEQYLGAELLRNRPSSSPGRSVSDLVNTQPGWLLEANGILHPRGSEYDVQYVIDGLPLFDNRSPAFAQSLGVEEFASMRILTGGYPAEYGRKLGGVIEVNTERDLRPGFHGQAILQAGSFASRVGYLASQYHQGKTTVGISAEGQMTDRYLDAPVEQNFTNYGSSAAFSGRLERDWSDKDRTRVYLYHSQAGFLVPNELLQEQAGQRQDRTSRETLGQFAHEHVFSARVLGLFQGRVRDTTAALWSNTRSTPIAPFQDRGFRESYANASISAHWGSHELKFGSEALFANIHEKFGFTITAYRLNGVRIFDRDVPQNFRFSDRGRDREQSAYVQDLWHWRQLTVSAGLRYDHYSLRVDEHAVSPRLGAAYHWQPFGLVLRASYDRVFQTPAIENILLASDDLAAQLGGGLFLPLRPSRGHFAEAGLSKTLGSHLRLDGTYFHRSLQNFPDDSLLFNTGVSFPTTFSNATIYGVELKLEVPRWGPFSGFASYGNMLGRGQLPVAGGLFLGDEADELVQSHEVFPITQDQRNTARSRMQFWLPGNRVSLAVGGRYNSGLPVEIEGVNNLSLLTQQYGTAILQRVNFARERVRPSASIDASIGADLWKREKRSFRVQADFFNLTDRLNVINFAGLFSGTAIEPGRNFAVRGHWEF